MVEMGKQASAPLCGQLATFSQDSFPFLTSHSELTTFELYIHRERIDVTKMYRHVV